MTHPSNQVPTDALPIQPINTPVLYFEDDFSWLLTFASKSDGENHNHSRNYAFVCDAPRTGNSRIKHANISEAQSCPVLA